MTPEPCLPDTGLPQKTALFKREWERTGNIPPVIDAEDVLRDPRRILEILCQALGVEVSDAMLSWRRGRRVTDGIWVSIE